MGNRIAAVVAQPSIDRHALVKPTWQCIVRVVHHAFVQNPMAFHRMWPQRVYLHNVIDSTLRPANAFVEVSQVAAALSKLDDTNPSAHQALQPRVPIPKFANPCGLGRFAGPLSKTTMYYGNSGVKKMAPTGGLNRLHVHNAGHHLDGAMI